MKLTAAFVAAALAVSGAHGLPIADSGTNLVVARSNITLDGGVMLQADKRGTDTDLVTRQLTHAGKAQQGLFARDASQLKEGTTITQREVLGKRAIGDSIANEVSHAGDLVHDVSTAVSPHGADGPDVGTLKLPDYADVGSTSTSGQLVQSPRKSAAEAATEHPDGTRKVKQPKQHRVDMYIWHAIENSHGKETQAIIPKEAMEQYKHRYHLSGSENLRAKDRDLSSDGIEREADAIAYLDKLKITPTTTRLELLRQLAHQEVARKSLTKKKSAFSAGLAKRRVAKEQIKGRIKVIKEHLERIPPEPRERRTPSSA